MTKYWKMAACALLLVAGACVAQDFPAKAVDLTVPFPPGGAADAPARFLGEGLSKGWKQPVVINNRAGAGGGVGAGYVKRATPDGYTLLVTNPGLLSLPESERMFDRTPPYERSDFQPLALLVADPIVLVVKGDAPWKTLQDFVADARKRPDAIAYGSSGVYGASHLPIEMVSHSAGIKLRHVPYKGGGPSIMAVMSGEVALSGSVPAAVAPYIKSGALRALVQTGMKRHPALPDVPTASELGYKDAEFYLWIGVFAPAKAPEAVTRRIRADIAQVVQRDPSFMQRMSAAGTRLQRAAGIEDSAGPFQEDMAAFTADLLPRDNERLRAMLAREAAPTVDWLERLGVAFAGPYPEPPHRVHRMHNTVPGPRLIVERLARTARGHGAQIVTNVSTQALVRDETGRVRGLDYTVEGRAHRAIAHGGVVLASGDFSGNDAMRSRHLPTGAARSLPINPENRGDGFALVEPTGAALRNMDAIFGPQLRFPRAARAGLNERMPAWPWLARLGARFFMRAPSWMLKPFVASLMIANMSPSQELFDAGAKLVDSKGCQLDAKRAIESVAHTPDRTGYIIMSDALAARFNEPTHAISTAPGIAYAYLADYERGRPDLVHRASGATGLARRLGMEAGKLAQALGSAAHGELLALGPVLAMLTTTEGSLAVDDTCRVLDEHGRAIAGLYAAGCMGQGGMLLRGHGLHLAWASGRVAGLQASAESRLHRSVSTRIPVITEQGA